ncbi:surfactant-associated protein 2 [Macrotis lagotis]|uniref:surfactant-associated protein 2 n=1 Tax=Macrotis lagotis TaxID=92651 RepID=UPI003D685B73
MLPPSHQFATMESWMLLFLLLIQPNKPQETGSRTIMHLKLQDAFSGNLSQVPHSQEFLEKVCHLLKLPLGTNITLRSPGSPHHVTC